MISLVSLAANIGGALGLSVMDNIFNSRISKARFSFRSSDQQSLDSIAGLDAATRQTLINTAKDAIVVSYYTVTAFSWLGLVSMSGVGNVQLGRRSSPQDKVWDGSYLLDKLFYHRGARLAEAPENESVAE